MKLANRNQIYGILGLIFVLFLGLWFNVKTIELNQKIHQSRRELHALKKENAYLEETVLSKTRLSEIERHVEETGLIFPKKIHYINSQEQAVQDTPSEVRHRSDASPSQNRGIMRAQ